MAISLDQAAQGSDLLTTFEARLRAAGAHAWTRESMNRYMAVEEAKLPGNLLWRLEQASNPTVGYVLGGLLNLLSGYEAVVTTVFCVVGFMFVAAMDAFFGHHQIQMLSDAFNVTLTLSVASVVVVGASYYLTNVARALGPGYWEWQDWHPHGPDLDGANMPKEAKAVAVSFEEANKNAGFKVALLRREGHTGIFDPVLAAVEKTPKGIVLHPMIVWDEHGKVVPPPTTT